MFLATAIIRSLIRKDVSVTRHGVALVALLAFFLLPSLSEAQQRFRPPDTRSMKHITTKNSDHAPDIPGNETVMDYYSGSGGEMVTVYSYRGRTVAFSSYNNSDVQNSFRIFLDMTGEGLFQEINRGIQWQLPQWAK
jgi:hypothetical protein